MALANKQYDKKKEYIFNFEVGLIHFQVFYTSTNEQNICKEIKVLGI
jgi:hypothetical protein